MTSVWREAVGNGRLEVGKNCRERESELMEVRWLLDRERERGDNERRQEACLQGQRAY